MGGNYAGFPRVLAWTSLFLALYIAGLVLFSHPLGFLGSTIIMCGWVLFVKVIHFVFEPEDISTYTQKDAVRETQRVALDDPRDYAARIAEKVYSLKDMKEEPSSSRILGSSQAQTHASSRLLTPAGGRVYQEDTPERRQREDDKEWADMFRAL